MMQIRVSKKAVHEIGDEYLVKSHYAEVDLSAYGEATIVLKWDKEKMPPFARVHLDRHTVWEIVMGMIQHNCDKVLQAAMKEFLSQGDKE